MTPHPWHLDAHGAQGSFPTAFCFHSYYFYLNNRSKAGAQQHLISWMMRLQSLGRPQVPPGPASRSPELCSPAPCLPQSCGLSRVGGPHRPRCRRGQELRPGSRAPGWQPVAQASAPEQGLWRVARMKQESDAALRWLTPSVHLDPVPSIRQGWLTARRARLFCASLPLRSEAGQGRQASPRTLMWPLPPAAAPPRASPPEPTRGCPRGSPEGSTRLSGILQGTREMGCDSQVLEELQQARAEGAWTGALPFGGSRVGCLGFTVTLHLSFSGSVVSVSL